MALKTCKKEAHPKKWSPKELADLTDKVDGTEIFFFVTFPTKKIYPAFSPGPSRTRMQQCAVIDAVPSQDGSPLFYLRAAGWRGEEEEEEEEERDPNNTSTQRPIARNIVAKQALLKSTTLPKKVQ